MSMRRIVIKGGYGEHGRSCFLVEYGTAGRYFMADCGIMDTDPNPFPAVTGEELGAVDYLFLTHCHKDHSGAFPYFVEKGFSGTLVTSAMTYELADLHYEKRIFLPVERQVGTICLGCLTIRYGRSGHCPGGLWFHIKDNQGSFFFSGDYQSRSLLYACDKVEGLEAELAVADCAHSQTTLAADELRAQLFGAAEDCLKAGRRILFPVPQYGRGLELLYLLKERFPEWRILADRSFFRYAEKMLEERVWYREEFLTKLGAGEILGPEPAFDIREDKRVFDILLLADTHLKKKENREFARQETDRGAVVFVTGRVKPESPPDQLLKEQKAVRVSFPHHQSRGIWQEN